MKAITISLFFLLQVLACNAQWQEILAMLDKDMLKNTFSEGHHTYEEAITPPWLVDEKPEYRGGQSRLAAYLQNRIRYTALAEAYGVEGRLILRFVIHSNGTVGNIEVLRSLGYGLDELAQKAIADMPAWKPAHRDGREVCTTYVLPISFTLTP